MTIADCYLEDKTGLYFPITTVYLNLDNMLKRIEEEIQNFAFRNNYIFKKLSRQRWEVLTGDNIYIFYVRFKGVETIQYETNPPMYSRMNYYVLTLKIY